MKKHGRNKKTRELAVQISKMHLSRGDTPETAKCDYRKILRFSSAAGGPPEGPQPRAPPGKIFSK